MQDVLYLALTAGFFAVCFAYVRGLDRIVRAAGDTEVTEVTEVTEAAGVDTAERDPEVVP